LFAAVVARDGDAARAESLLAGEAPAAYGAAVARAMYHLARREFDQCAESIGHAVRERDSRVPFILPFLRSTAQWPTIARMMNLQVT
jgi:hypothetical protein